MTPDPKPLAAEEKALLIVERLTASEDVLWTGYGLRFVAKIAT